MQLVRDLAGRDDGGAALAGGVDLVQALLSAGLVRLLLSMLKALRPISQKAAAAGGEPLPTADLAPMLALQSAAFPYDQPYFGYRSDVLAALGNTAKGRPAVAAEVAALGGAELVLAQALPDRESPLSREWALWAVRNLGEGSPTARDALRELRACAAGDSEELRWAGVRLELDEASGKLRVVQRGNE